jgi:hypothetical protein
MGFDFLSEAQQHGHSLKGAKTRENGRGEKGRTFSVKPKRSLLTPLPPVLAHVPRAPFWDLDPVFDLTLGLQGTLPRVLVQIVVR